jgi:hypothetical protein
VGSRSKARARAQASQAGGHSSLAPRQLARSRGPQPQASSRPRQTGSSPSPSGTEGLTGIATDAERGPRPRTVLALAVIEAIEAVGVLVAAILAGLDTGTGKSYHLASGIAITLIGLGTAVALGFVARGLWAGSRWTRTPALLTQLFTGIVGIYLVQSARYDWGIPALALTLGGFAMLLAPASVRVLTPGRVQKPGEG